MTTAVNVNRSKVMKSAFYLLLMAAVALATSFARGESTVQAPVSRSVQVKQVTGKAEYAYDGKVWQALSAGETLRAGASIRTGDDGIVILAMEEKGSLVRVGPMRRFKLAAATAEDAASLTITPGLTRICKSAALATKFAAQ